MRGEDNMYTWGYIKDVTLMKLDLDEDEANTLNLMKRFKHYANEAITIICSSVKPKKTFATIVVTKDDIGKPITIPDKDFISFGDDVNRITQTEYNMTIVREATDSDFVHCGYNQIIPYVEGTFAISYNTRWITFLFEDYNEDGVDDGQDDDTELDVPADILECLPSYIASQCMKVDDEYKSATLRNDFELMLARIDDTDFKSNKTFFVGGDW